ncbi:transmembrane protein 120A isoform X2 [Strongylocentrotus purpuratus]|uniref:Transmembrane protein 120A n=1 Tax=Strongylocentrotus purpuratus TaxID=7668 RepID=A0A7M7P979_STRPU|nr:transmembrane protein 120A isoform X2 [Strongylocentrotus purpuratus]
MADSCLTGFAEEIDDLAKEYESMKELHKKYKDKLEEVQSMQKKCATLVGHQKKRYKQIAEGIKEKSPGLSGEEKAKCNELKTLVEDRKKNCIEVLDTLPRSNNFLLSTTLGPVSVSILSKKDRFAYKEEYERFKLYLSIIMLVGATINTFFIKNSPMNSPNRLGRICDACYHFLLVWFYCTLVIRESILRHNGSRIKGWWVVHHYLTVMLTAILLIWPDSVSYRMFRNQFMLFSLYLSVVQLIQYYYQSGCLYRLRALGEKSDMYITVEGFQNWMWRGLTFLLPFLFVAYTWQLYNAYSLYHIAKHPECNEWMVPVASVIFLCLFLGNMITTSGVILTKFKAMQSTSSSPKNKGS